jgi:hypothetical protein
MKASIIIIFSFMTILHASLLFFLYLLLQIGPEPGLRLAQPGGPTDRLSALFSPFLPEDGSRIQLLTHCSFIIL